MERRIGKGVSEKKARLKRVWPAALASAGWFIVLFYFLSKTGYSDAIRKAAEPIEGTAAGLLLTPFILPTVFAAYTFLDRPYSIPESVPKVMRPSVRILDTLSRGLAWAGAWYLFTTAYILVPPLAMVVFFFGYMVYAIALLIHRYIQEKAARRTVTALYEALKNDDQGFVASSCEPEAVDDIALLETRVGKLTWFQVMNIMYEEKHFTFMVQSIRDKVTKFEEVIIRPNGNRVVQVLAKGV